MKESLGIIITLLVILSPTYPLQAQGIRAGGFASRGISRGIRGGRVGTIGSGSRGMVSNFRPGFGQASSSPSFRGNSVGIGGGIANSPVSQGGFGQNIQNSGPSFGLNSNLARSTLGRHISNPRFQPIPDSANNTTAPATQGYIPLGSRPIKRARSRLRATDNSFAKTDPNSVSSNNVGNTPMRLKHPLIIDKRGSRISRRSNAIGNGNEKRTLTGKTEGVIRVNRISSPSAGNRNIIHWVDGHNGIKHYTNDVNSIPEEAKTITLVDAKKPRLTSGFSEGTVNLKDSRPRLIEASRLTNPGRTANLVTQKTVDFSDQHSGFAMRGDHERRNIRNVNHADGFDHDKFFADSDSHKFRHHDFHRDFHHNRFFPLDPFIFNNSFFFISPVFPLSNFFFNPFVFQSPAIFPSRFFGFQPFFIPAAPVVFIPVSPQFTTFTPFIDPFLLNPFFSPFLFGTDFFSTSIAFNNFF